MLDRHRGKSILKLNTYSLDNIWVMVDDQDKVQPIRSMDTMTYHIWVWKIVGIWPPSSTSTSARTAFLYRMYSILIFGFFYVLFSISLLLHLFFVYNLSGVVDTLMVSSTVLLATLKGICIRAKLSKLRQMFDIINRLDDFVITDEQRELIHLSTKHSRRLVIMLSCCYYCGVNTGLVLSLVGSEINLMWPAWYPGIPWQDDLKWFWIVLLYQYVASLCAAFMDSSADVYGTALNNLLCAHLESLSLRLKNIGNKGDSVNDHIDIHLTKKWDIEFKECVKYYSSCIR